MPNARFPLFGVFFLALPLCSLEAQQRDAPRIPLKPAVVLPLVNSRADTREHPTLPTPAFSVDPENRSLIVLVGALVGATVGAWAYRHQAASLNDGDFAAPLSIAVFVGGGALLGGAVAWIFIPRAASSPLVRERP